uniref:Uncharacterized protein n=1 Tax=Nelumbo nucifera TaxID=4432 RepID=A0A822ZL71_NELNU|nr:TPA_asm: hypothetical protein HUJ06_002425 [Nelumbo nucifera]
MEAGGVTHHSPTQVLKNFNEIRRLRIELPGGELGIEDGVLLKWRANPPLAPASYSVLHLSFLREPPNPHPCRKMALVAMACVLEMEMTMGTSLGRSTPTRA